MSVGRLVGAGGTCWVYCRDCLLLNALACEPFMPALVGWVLGAKLLQAHVLLLYLGFRVQRQTVFLPMALCLQCQSTYSSGLMMLVHCNTTFGHVLSRSCILAALSVVLNFWLDCYVRLCDRSHVIAASVGAAITQPVLRECDHKA